MDIYTSLNFVVKTNTPPEVPHNSRGDGGHLIISPKIEISSRQDMSPEVAKEFIWLTIVVGEAFMNAMNKLGVDVKRINYQDNGNYRPVFHYHLYGRAQSANNQLYGRPFVVFKEDFEKWKDNEPLTQADGAMIKQEIEQLIKTKYLPTKWGVAI